jgi:hypothetical protein
VDGNAADITTNATAISNKVASVTGEGGLSASGVGNDVTIKRSRGFVSINHTDFVRTNQINGDACNLFNINKVAYYSNTSTSADCIANAALTLPHEAKISWVSCKLFKNAGGNLIVNFVKRDVTTETQSNLTRMQLTVNEAAWKDVKIQFLVPPSIDNENNVYFMELDMGDTDTANDFKGIKSCVISYFF